MLPSYFRRLQIPPPSSSLLFIILTFLIVCCRCCRSVDLKSLDNYVCAKDGAASLPNGVAINHDQIRFSSVLAPNKDVQILKTQTDDINLEFTVVSDGKCNFEATKCTSKKTNPDTRKHVATGKCSTYHQHSCTTHSFACKNVTIYHVKDMADARLIVFKPPAITGTCEWDAFIDNARFLLTNLNEERAEQCIKTEGTNLTWLFVTLGVIGAILAIIAVSICVVVLVRYARLRRQQKQNKMGQQQGAMPTQSMWRRAFKMPKIVLFGGRRGSKTKADGGGQTDEKTKHGTDPSSRYVAEPSKYVDDPSSKFGSEAPSKYGSASSSKYGAGPSTAKADNGFGSGKGGGSAAKAPSITEPSSKFQVDPSSKYRVDPSSKYRVDPTSKYRVDPSSNYGPASSSKHDATAPSPSNNAAATPTSKGGGSAAKSVVDASGGRGAGGSADKRGIVDGSRGAAGGGSAAKAQPQQPSTNKIIIGVPGPYTAPKSVQRSAYF